MHFTISVFASAEGEYKMYTVTSVITTYWKGFKTSKILKGKAG